jgi:hypothetical protein
VIEIEFHLKVRNRVLVQITDAAVNDAPDAEEETALAASAT